MTGRLPQPIGRQKEVLYLPAQGHYAVLGTAGSGKTTLAILRSAYLSNSNTDHGGQTLLVTFNRALVTYLKYLQDRSIQNVVVENYHKFARRYLDRRGKMPNHCICSDPDERIRLIENAKEKIAENYKKHSFFDRSIETFSEEIRWISKNGLLTADDYKDAERIGRAGARINRKLRKVMFEIYETYLQERSIADKLYDWDDLACAVRQEFEQDDTPRMYKHVVIDEGQDFSPEMIRSLSLAIPADGSLTFFGDVAQQIYGHRMSWRTAGLTISKVWKFRDNYRNTKQVAKLALAIAQTPYFPTDADLVEPKSPNADGPLPALVSFESQTKEQQYVADLAKRYGQTGTVAVLFRDREQERTVSSYFGGGTRLHRDLATWPSQPGIFYGTYHAAKGLEFDAVILPFLSDSTIPHPPDVEAFGDSEAAALDSRLLYVAVTRARSTLVLTYSGEPTKILPCEDGLFQRSRG
jgi:superfamily I DNA/RNA helicase